MTNYFFESGSEMVENIELSSPSDAAKCAELFQVVNVEFRNIKSVVYESVKTKVEIYKSI